MVFHFLLAVDLAARVQKFLKVMLPNQFLELRRGQTVLCQVAKIQVVSAFLHEAAGFSTRRARRLVKELDSFSGLLCTGCGLAHELAHSLPRLGIRSPFRDPKLASWPNAFGSRMDLHTLRIATTYDSFVTAGLSRTQIWWKGNAAQLSPAPHIISGKDVRREWRKRGRVVQPA